MPTPALKGISVERVNDHYEIANFHMPQFVNGTERVLDLSDAPPRLLEVFDKTFRLIDDQTLLRETGLSRAQASTRLTRLKRKFLKKADGRLTWDRPEMHRQELALMQFLNSIIVFQPAYTGEDFFNEFASLLKLHGFMDDGQDGELSRRRSQIILFAVVAMHGVQFIMHDGNKVEAEAGWTSDSGQALLRVSARTNVAGHEVVLLCPILTTDVRAAEWSDIYDPALRHASWLVPLELSPQGRIRAIG